MGEIKRRRELIPRWDMPADPVKAVFWFMHWLLKVLVRFFSIPVLAGVIVESILNGVVGGVVTLLVGLAIWGGLAVLLLFFNISTTISEGITGVNRMQQRFPPRSDFSNFGGRGSDDRVVEGTITDLEEERRKRRQE